MRSSCDGPFSGTRPVDFSLCFENTVLGPLSSLVVIAVLGSWLYENLRHSSKQPSSYLRWTVSFKLITTFQLVILHALIIWYLDGSFSTARIHHALASALMLPILFISIYLEETRFIPSNNIGVSVATSIAWLVHAAVELLRTRTHILISFAANDHGFMSTTLLMQLAIGASSVFCAISHFFYTRKSASL